MHGSLGRHAFLHKPLTKNGRPREEFDSAQTINVLWDPKVCIFNRQSFGWLLKSRNPLTPHCFKTLLLQCHAISPHPALCEKVTGLLEDGNKP